MRTSPFDSEKSPRRVVVEEPVTLQPRQQVDVVARTTVPYWKTPETTPTVDMVNNHSLRP